MSQHTQKALLVCLFFACVGAFGLFRTGFLDAESTPLFIYYGILIVNTFFSIRTFSAITPKNATQVFFDVVLVGIYIILALSFSAVLLFSVVSTGLFLVAIAKYVHLNRLITSRDLLRRKIKINVLGALLSCTTFAIAVLGYYVIAAWTLCAIFFVANVYVLAINPMYRSSANGS